MAIASALSGGSGPVADELAVTAEILRRSTVHVRNGRQGGGSGVIWRPDGLIITNAHVARSEHVEVELSDGRQFDGQVTAHDPRRDLASVVIQATDLPAAPIADSDALRVGQVVAAVGNPLGLTGALTLGIIHAIAPAEGRGGGDWVQADVDLAPGNSGGPLADVLGRVIGINSMVSGSLGLAVPSNAVTRFLLAGDRPRLGLNLQPVTIGTPAGPRDGMLVLDVSAGSPGERGGIFVGDILLGAAGKPFAGPRTLVDALIAAGTGGILRLDVLRGGVPQTLTIQLDAEDAKRTARAA